MASPDDTLETFVDFESLDIKSDIITPEKERDLKPGDHIAVSGSRIGIEYFHHGIFISHKDGVVDLNGADKRSSAVSKRPLAEFTHDGSKRRKLIRFVYKASAIIRTAKETVREALQIAKTQNWEAYGLLLNNCEHFAMYCKTGHKISLQVIKFMREFIETEDYL